MRPWTRSDSALSRSNSPCSLALLGWAVFFLFFRPTFHLVDVIAMTLTDRICCIIDGRCDGDDDSGNPIACTALWLVAVQLEASTHQYGYSLSAYCVRKENWSTWIMLYLYYIEPNKYLQVVFGGMMFSSTLWGNICDKYGRRAVSSLINPIEIKCLMTCLTMFSFFSGFNFKCRINVLFRPFIGCCAVLYLDTPAQGSVIP